MEGGRWKVAGCRWVTVHTWGNTHAWKRGRPAFIVTTRAGCPPHGGRCFGTPLCAISRFSHQDAQTPPSPRVGERGWGDFTGVDVSARPCVPSPVSAIRMPRLPLLPVWEKGDGGMRGNGARERRTSLISPKNSTRERGCPRSREKCEHLLHSLTSNICSCILALYSNPV